MAASRQSAIGGEDAEETALLKNPWEEPIYTPDRSRKSECSNNLTPPKEEEEEEDVEDEELLVPDGGWGWVVCFGSFAVNFILDGTMFSFGVLMLALLDDLGEDKSTTSWIGSAQMGIHMTMGPVINILLKRFSIRQVAVSGSLLATAAFIASVFSPNVYVLIFTFGVLGGVGFGLVFLPAIIVVGLYFNKKRAIATGIATSGSGLGTFAFAYLTDILLENYNWRGTILILAGILLNCAVCGLLFRPLVPKPRKRKKVLTMEMDGEVVKQPLIAGGHHVANGHSGETFLLQKLKKTESQDTDTFIPHVANGDLNHDVRTRAASFGPASSPTHKATADKYKIASARRVENGSLPGLYNYKPDIVVSSFDESQFSALASVLPKGTDLEMVSVEEIAVLPVDNDSSYQIRPALGKQTDNSIDPSEIATAISSAQGDYVQHKPHQLEPQPENPHDECNSHSANTQPNFTQDDESDVSSINPFVSDGERVPPPSSYSCHECLDPNHNHPEHHHSDLSRETGNGPVGDTNDIKDHSKYRALTEDGVARTPHWFLKDGGQRLRQNPGRMCKSVEHLHNVNRRPISGVYELRKMNSEYGLRDGDRQLFGARDAGDHANLKHEIQAQISRGLMKPVLRRDIYYSGSVSHLPAYQHLGSMTSFMAAMTRASSSESDDVLSSGDQAGSSECCRKCNKWFPSALFTNKIFVLLLVTFTMWTVQSVPLTYIPDLAVSSGISRSDAAFLISIVGIANVMGRLVAGFITDCFHVPSIWLYFVALTVASIVNLVLPFCEGYVLLQVCSAVFGLCMAVAVSMRTIVLAEQLGISVLTESFGLVAWFQGIAFVVNPPIAGKLIDEFHSFQPPFMMTCFMYGLSAVSALLVACLNRSNAQRMRDPQTVEIAVVPAESVSDNEKDTMPLNIRSTTTIT